MPTQLFPNPLLPNILTALPGPKAKDIISRDHAVVSPSYTRGYPLVMKRGEGAIIDDVDGNRFLDFAAGIPWWPPGIRIRASLRRSRSRLLSSSTCRAPISLRKHGATCRETRSTLRPAASPRRVYFRNTARKRLKPPIKLARYHTGRDKFVAFLGSFHGRTMGALFLSPGRAR